MDDLFGRYTLEALLFELLEVFEEFEEPVSIEVDSLDWVAPEIRVAAEKLLKEHNDHAVVTLLAASIPFPQAYAAMDVAKRNQVN